MTNGEMSSFFYGVLLAVIVSISTRVTIYFTARDVNKESVTSGRAFELDQEIYKCKKVEL
jgi:hypothetical protein